jgi:hypothetical protein
VKRKTLWYCIDGFMGTSLDVVMGHAQYRRRLDARFARERAARAEAGARSERRKKAK